MKLLKYILLFSVIILVLIFFYSWIMDHVLFRVGYPTVHSSHSSLSNFKINDRAVISNHIENSINSIKKLFITKNEFYKCSSSDCMVLAAVCCGDRANQTYAMVKSAIVLSHSPLVIELFTEENLFPFFKSLESQWPESVKSRVKMNLRPANYPPGINEKTWRNLFLKCASIRLFLPSLLNDVDALVYVDTDILFLAPLENLWRHFSRMNASHMAALTPEGEDAATGWYNRFAKHPYFGKLGVNSGVMLMNLTRLRAFGWVEYVVPIQKEFHSVLTWGDQDIINIIFHYHPDKLYLLGCEYNYRPDHCMYMSICEAIDHNGVFALHGSRGTFVNDKQPVFKIIFRAWNEFNLEDDLRQNFYYPVSKYFILNTTKSNCGKLRKQFLKNIEKMIVL